MLEWEYIFLPLKREIILTNQNYFIDLKTSKLLWAQFSLRNACENVTGHNPLQLCGEKLFSKAREVHQIQEKTSKDEFESQILGIITAWDLVLRRVLSFFYFFCCCDVTVCCPHNFQSCWGHGRGFAILSHNQYYPASLRIPSESLRGRPML